MKTKCDSCKFDKLKGSAYPCNSCFDYEMCKPKDFYWDNICIIQEKQTAKGIRKYGDVLENNPTDLDVFERLQYIQEELIDALMYIEHLKIKLEEN